jgi:hypothetical protein
MSLTLALALVAFAPPPSMPEITEPPEQLARTKRADKQLSFFGYFLTRAEMTNVAPANDLFNGQIVGRLFGPNSTTTSKKRAVFLEQRFVPYMVYEPTLMRKKARLRASFELDWTFGDTSNSTGGNFGSAITADQVNLQTQNLAVEIDFAKGWYVDVGLQRLFDGALDPYRTTFEQLSTTGERLSTWGTDAVGVTVHGMQWGQKFKFGAYQLYENLIQEDDDVVLLEAATDRHLGHTWHVGGSFRYLRDASEGAGGVGILGQGPDSQLADYTGVYRFTIPDDAESWRGHFAWAGANASYNPLFAAGRLGGSAFVNTSLGQIVTEIPGQSGDYRKLANILGVAANLRLGVRYGRTPGDHVVGEVLYTSGDHDGLEDGTYSGVVTGNTWGAPAALFTSHGAYLLMPHATVVNRYYAAVSDISNAGFGVTAATLNVAYDIVRDKLGAKVGAAVARSNIQPIEGGNYIGTEVNGKVTWRARPLLHLEAHGAVLMTGDYYDSPEILTLPPDSGSLRNPWTVFLALKWLMI